MQRRRSRCPRSYHIDSENPNAEVINLAATVLRDGGIVVFPTETVYGIGALADSKFGPQEIFEVKVRPLDKPICPGSSRPRTRSTSTASTSPSTPTASPRRSGPAPLTLVVKASDRVARDFRAPGRHRRPARARPRGRHRAHPGGRRPDHRDVAPTLTATRRPAPSTRSSRASSRRRRLARWRRDRAPAAVDRRRLHG